MELPYVIKENEELGRYIVAREDLEPLTTVIKEKPVVCAPADNYIKGRIEVPMCLGCCAKMSSCSENRCSKCHWPVCSVPCENKRHHSDYECKLFEEVLPAFEAVPKRHLLYESVFIIRCLLSKRRKDQLWTNYFTKLEHHNEIRRKKTLCQNKDKNIWENIKSIFSNMEDLIWFTWDDVVQVSGAINVNAFCSEKLENECGKRSVARRLTTVLALYPTAFLMAHSCVPNAFWSVSGSPNFEMTIKTTVKIPKGHIISIAYAPKELYLGTLQRLVSKEEVAHFVCKCCRCVDPTELGTNISSIKCPVCNDSIIYNNANKPGYLVPEDCTDSSSCWKCMNCSNTWCASKVVKTLSKIENQFEAIKDLSLSPQCEVGHLEELWLDSETSCLHPNHFLLLEISLRIVTKQSLYIYSLEDVTLDRFICHCNLILEVSNVISPGYCHSRAILLFFKAQALMIKVRRAKTKNVHLLTEIQEIQNDAYSSFQCEGSSSSTSCQFIACLIEEMKECRKYLAH